MQAKLANKVSDSRVPGQGAAAILPAMHVGERIKYARTIHRLNQGLPIMTQEALSEAVGMTRGKLSLIELGDTKTVSEGDLRAIAGALEVSPCWLAVGVGQATEKEGSAGIDPALLEGIMEAVLEYISQHGLTTTPRRLARFVARRYTEEAQKSGPINREEIAKLLDYIQD